MRKKLYLSAFVCGLFILTGCKITPTGPDNKVPVTGVSIDVDHITLDVGEEQTFNAIIEPSNATNTRVSWSIDDSTVGTFTNRNTGAFKALGPGDTTVTVTTSDGGFTDTCELHVNEVVVKTLDSLSVNVHGQNSFFVGDEFKHDLIEVTALYSDGTSEQVFDYDISDPNMDNLGNQTVTVSYTEGDVTVNTSYVITVKALGNVESIKLDTKNVLKTFAVNSTFSYEGLVVTAIYDTGAQRVVTDYSVSNPNMSTAGQKDVTVTYMGDFTAKYIILVNAQDGKVRSFETLIGGAGAYPESSGNPFEVIGMVASAYKNVYNYNQYYIQSVFEKEPYAISVYGYNKTTLAEGSLVKISGTTNSKAITRYQGMPQITAHTDSTLTFTTVKSAASNPYQIEPVEQTSANWVNNEDPTSDAYMYAYHHGPIMVRVKEVQATEYGSNLFNFTFRDHTMAVLTYKDNVESIANDIKTKITDYGRQKLNITGFLTLFSNADNYAVRLAVRKTSDVVLSSDPGGGDDPGDPADDKSFKVYAINDFHGAVLETSDHIGLAKVGSLFKEINKYEENTLILDQGDDWQGSIYSNYNRGKLVNDVFAYSGMDARTVGNHDFDWGVDTLIENASRSYDLDPEFDPTPVLAANVYNYDNELKEETDTQCSDIGAKSIVKTLENGLKVGVVGAIGRSQFTSILSTNTTDIYFKEHVAVMKAEAARLKEEGCDVIIGSIHCAGEDLLNTGLSDSFNLVLCGHSHANEEYLENGTYFLQFGSYGKRIGAINLTYNTGTKKIKTTFDTITPTTIDSVLRDGVDQGVVDIIDSYNNETLQHEDPTEVLVAKSSGKFAAGDKASSTSTRGQLGNVMATAIYDECRKDSRFADVDLTLVNTARTSTSKTSNWTYADIYEMFPFDNEICIETVKGSDITYVVGNLEYSYFSYFRSGFNFTINPNAYYKIAVIDYLLYHVNVNKVYNYFKSFDGTPEGKLSITYRYIIRDWLIANGYASGAKTLTASDFLNTNERYNRSQLTS